MFPKYEQRPPKQTLVLKRSSLFFVIPTYWGNAGSQTNLQAVWFLQK